MGITREQSLSQYGTEAYTGWDQNGANADFQAKGGQAGSQTSSGGGSADDLVNKYKEYFTGLISQIKPYDEVNPFAFDEQLAKQASTAEYSPYYNEMLTDYTSQVERTKSRSQEDLTKTLEQLQAGKEYYMGTERRVLDRALDSTNKGYAGQNLFFSGAREKDIGQLKTDYAAQTGEYTRQYGTNVAQAQQTAQRTTEDVNTAQSQYGRDTERSKQYAIESGVLQRKTEAVNQYEMGRKKYYESQGVYTG